MKRIVIILVLFFGVCAPNKSQELIKLYFKNLHRGHEYSNYSAEPAYYLLFDTLKIIESDENKTEKIYPIVLPDLGGMKDTAWFKLFFTGYENSAFSRSTVFLAGNYTSDTTYIWCDQNNNLDFTDDGDSYLITPEKPYLYVQLHNSELPKGYFLYKLGKAVYQDTNHRNNVKEYFFNDDPEDGFITTDVDYWFGSQRLNILSCDTVIEGKKIQFGLMDWDCNGLFADIDTMTPENYGSDRILIAGYGDTILRINPAAGATAFLPETYIPVHGIMYKVHKIDRYGRFMVISKTDSIYSILKEGDTIPDLHFQTLDNKVSNLHKELDKGKYNLIDFWGFWCKPCISALPLLKDMMNQYKDKLNIIGLHCYQSHPQMAFDTIEKNDVNWTKGFLTQEIEKELLSGGKFPYYLLVDGNGKIIKLDTSIDEVKRLLEGE